MRSSAKVSAAAGGGYVPYDYKGYEGYASEKYPPVKAAKTASRLAGGAMLVAAVGVILGVSALLVSLNIEKFKRSLYYSFETKPFRPEQLSWDGKRKVDAVLHVGRGMGAEGRYVFLVGKTMKTPQGLGAGDFERYRPRSTGLGLRDPVLFAHLTPPAGAERDKFAEWTMVSRGGSIETVPEQRCFVTTADGSRAARLALVVCRWWDKAKNQEAAADALDALPELAIGLDLHDIAPGDVRAIEFPEAGMPVSQLNRNSTDAPFSFEREPVEMTGVAWGAAEPVAAADAVAPFRSVGLGRDARGRYAYLRGGSMSLPAGLGPANSQEMLTARPSNLGVARPFLVAHARPRAVADAVNLDEWLQLPPGARIYAVPEQPCVLRDAAGQAFRRSALLVCWRWSPEGPAKAASSPPEVAVAVDLTGIADLASLRSIDFPDATIAASSRGWRLAETNGAVVYPGDAGPLANAGGIGVGDGGDAGGPAPGRGGAPTDLGGNGTGGDDGLNGADTGGGGSNTGGQQDPEGGGTDAGAIIGGVLGALAALALVGGVAYYVSSSRRKVKQRRAGAGGSGGAAAAAAAVSGP